MSTVLLCLCGCPKDAHKQGRKACARCGVCDRFDLDGEVPTSLAAPVVQVPDADPASGDVEQLRALVARIAEAAGRDIADPPTVDLVARVAELRRGREEATARALELVKELHAERGKNGRLATELGETREPGHDVLSTYDAWQCLTCGARYIPATAAQDHPHPLTPVRVTIAHRTEGTA